MLQFLLDEEKEKTFLKFWGLKKVEEYKTFHKTDRMFLQYVRLNEIQHRLNGAILFKNIEQGFCNLTQGRLVHDGEQGSFLKSDFNLAENIEKEFEVLSSLGILKIQKNRSYLESKSDKISFTHEFYNFLKNKRCFPLNSEDLDAEKKTEKTKVLKEAEKKYLEYFEKNYVQFHFSKIFEEEKNEVSTLLSLVEKKHLLLGFQKNTYRPLILLNEASYINRRPSESFEFDLQSTPLFYHKIDRCLYSLHLKKGLEKKEKNSREEKTILEKRAEKWGRLLFLKRAYKRYLTLSFKKKICYLLEIISPNRQGLESLKVLIDFYRESKQEVIFEKAFFYEINKKRLLVQKENLSYEAYLRGLDRLEKMAILKIKGEWIVFSKTLLNFILKKRVEKSAESSNEKKEAIIDTDGTISYYRDKSLFQRIYYLNIFCEVSASDYMISAGLSLDKMAFAWFCGFTPKKIKLFLKKIAPKYYNDAVSGLVDSRFKQLEAFKSLEGLLALKVQSAELYGHAMFLLKKQLPKEAQLLFLEKHRLVLFFRKKDYQLATECLRSQKWLVF